MYNKQLLVKAQRMGIIDQSIGLWVAEKNFGAGTIAVAQPIELEATPMDEGMTIEPYPALTMSDQEAQALMDSLWDCGLRPSEGHGSAGSLAATQKHLADMRAIVENKLKVHFK